MLQRRPVARRAASRIGVAGLALVVLSAGSFRIAEAHDKGILKLGAKTFRAGDSLAVSGTKFTPNDELTLALVGVNGRVALADVPTDTAGAFRRVLLVPATVAAGQYRLVAEAIDGDEVAVLEVAVVGAAAAGTPMGSMPGMPGMPGHEGMEMTPTGEALSLERARSGVVTTTTVVLIIACVLAGAALLRSPRAKPMEEVS